MFPTHVSAALSAARASEHREAARRRRARARATPEPVRRSPFGLIATVTRVVLPRRSQGARRVATS